MNTNPYKHAIIMLLDGARPDVINSIMKKGDLPHLSRLCEKGANREMVTCFPSTTGPAYLPYLTGCFPGTCNVPGVRWFDKKHYARKGWGYGSFRSYVGLETMLFDRDMKREIKTAWEVMDRSYSINNGVTRGLTLSRNRTFGRRIWNYYYAHLTDRWEHVDMISYKALQQVIQNRDFEFVFMVYPGVDEFSHRSSPFHPRVIESYQEVDALVGRTVQDLKDKGLYEETLLMLVSDHGLSETKEHFDIGPWLETEKKIKTFYYSNICKFRFEASSMVSGNGMTHLYFKGRNSWKDRTNFEELSYDSILLDELRLREEVDLVVSQGSDGAIHLQTALGHSHYNWDEERGVFIYRYADQDPLGIFKARGQGEMVEMTPDMSLERTFDSQYPDVFVQMQQIFSSPRTGDVVVSAKPGFDLRVKFEHPLHKASHGSICPEHMKIPLIMNHPVDAEFIRSVDTFPTVLKLLGREIPQGVDGRCLA